MALGKLETDGGLDPQVAAKLNALVEQVEGGNVPEVFSFVTDAVSLVESKYTPFEKGQIGGTFYTDDATQSDGGFVYVLDLRELGKGFFSGIGVDQMTASQELQNALRDGGVNSYWIKYVSNNPPPDSADGLSRTYVSTPPKRNS